MSGLLINNPIKYLTKERMITINWLDEKINSIKFQIDYYLMHLHEAIQQENIIQRNEAKLNLERLVEQLKQWEGNRSE